MALLDRFTVAGFVMIEGFNRLSKLEYKSIFSLTGNLEDTGCEASGE